MAELKRKRKVVKPTETILDTEKFMFKDEPRTESRLEEGKILIDYTLKPHASNGKPAFAVALAGTLWFISLWIILYKAEGAESMPAAACGTCGILCSIVAVIYSILGFREKERNYTFCWIAVILAGLQIISWIITLLLTAGK